MIRVLVVMCCALAGCAGSAGSGRATSPASASPATTSTTAAPSSTAGLFVVAPASCGALSYGADGNASPVTCPDRRPNLAADRYFRAFQPTLRVLQLGPDAAPADVTVAICADRKSGHATIPIEQSAYELALAEQDWHFGADPSSVLLSGGCPS